MQKKLNRITNILLYGCIWGMLELTLGGMLLFIHFPQQKMIMAAAAFVILMTYLNRHKDLRGLVIIGLIAAVIRTFDVFIFGIPLFSRPILSPALGIIVEAVSVSAAAFVFSRLGTILAFYRE